MCDGAGRVRNRDCVGGSRCGRSDDRQHTVLWYAPDSWTAIWACPLPVPSPQPSLRVRPRRLSAPSRPLRPSQPLASPSVLTCEKYATSLQARGAPRM